MELDYKIQTYEWGKRGLDSIVARLYANVNKAFNIQDTVAYSELWLGTHVNGPSSLKNGDLLSKLLSENPEFLGGGVRSHFGDQLPFLFKVLSVNQALSVQAHPSKQHAEELHNLRPDIYKDSNHKPELAIALTQFEALCGFRPLEEIFYFLKNIPELNALVANVLDSEKTENVNTLKKAFKSVFVTSKDIIGAQLRKLLERFKILSAAERENQYADLIERLYKTYPDDVGCFMVYFLNYLKLEPFESIYLGANIPHAYLSGDCIECMACSDNVVRAGLTPKYIDVDTLCSMLIYDGAEAKQFIFKPIVENEHVQVFKPPVLDFEVVQFKIPASLKVYTIQPKNTARIFIVIEGNANIPNGTLLPGRAIFLPANHVLEVTDITQDLLIYQGQANIS